MHLATYNSRRLLLVDWPPAPSVAKEWLASRQSALRRSSRRARLALLCFPTRLLGLCLLGTRVQLRLRFDLFHITSCYMSLPEFHWPEFGGGVCAEIVLTSAA
jgi:hypothetical protein